MAYQGKLIEYLEHGRFVCAIVLEDTGKRLRLVNQNGRDVSLPPARVMHQSTKSCPLNVSRDELVKELKAVGEKRQVLKAAINLPEVWEIVREEPENTFPARLLAELSFGEDATDDHEAAFLRSVFEDPLYFKYKDEKILVCSEEVVEQHRIRLEKELQKKAFMDASVKELQALTQGLESSEWPDRDKCLRILADYYLHGSEAPESALARDLLKASGLTRPHDVYHLLIKAGVWSRNENVPLLRYDLPVEFPDEAYSQAEELLEADAGKLLAEGRRDLRDLPVLTIDGEATRDFDDALHVEKQADGFLVGIHITDVSRYIKPGTALFEEARHRAISVYLPDGQIPMLPASLSEGICSLMVDKDRPAISFMVRLSATAEVLDVDIVPSVVRVKRRLSYVDAETLLQTDEDLRNLYFLARELQKRRLEAGAILLPIPDVNITIGEDDEVVVGLSDVNAPARMLVAEFMVLANTLGASYVANQEVSGLFRCQKPPGQQLIHGIDKDLFVNFRQRRYLSPAQVLTRPQRHSCVGVEQYTTVTSPIRRFLDLVMQHQIASLISGKGAMFSDKDLKNMVPGMIAAQSKVNLVKRLRHRYWLLKYLEKKVGEQLEALILEKGPRRVAVVLLDVLMEGDLPPNQAAVGQPGDTVKVKVGKVSPLDDVLRLEW